MGIKIELSDQELINFAKQDGATVIDMQGQFRGYMILLRPDAAPQAVKLFGSPKPKWWIPL
jgi:hypothetical protein